jgi:hypothetical protein
MLQQETWLWWSQLYSMVVGSHQHHKARPARCHWITPVVLATWGGWDQEDWSSSPAQNRPQSPN